MRKRRFAILSVTLLLAAGAAAAEVTIENLLAPAFPSSPLASPDGHALAWLENERGARSVWTAEAPAWKARRVADFPNDDGLELSQLAWSPDRSAVVFVRGGDEGGAPKTNPTSNPAGAKATVWYAEASGKHPARALGEGGEPAVSPRGDRVVFVRGGQLWAIGLGKKASAAQLTHLKGEQGGPRFSPDGAAIAFVSHRQTHAFVGVLDAAAQHVVWLDPGVDRDLAPAWSPDGKAIAFVRLAARHKLPAFVARRTGQPWSIRVADPATGKGHEVFLAAPGDGSVFHFFETQETNLWWTADGRLVFPWEKSGWNHLVSIPAAGGAAVDLTPGKFEVEHATLAPDGKTFDFTCNEGDLDGRRLERVAAAGGPTERLDAGDEKFEFYPTPLAGGALAWLESAARQPLTAMLRDGSGATRPLRPGEVATDFPATELVTPRNVVFTATDGLAIHGQLFAPADAGATKRPGVIFVHGGPPRQMYAAFHPMDYYSGAYALNQYLVAHGFVVLSVNYRSGIGYGLAFREATGIGEDGATEFRDVLGGALYLKSLPGVDGARIGIWGGSYGGYLTALALARASDLFKAGVDFHGVHDWNLEFPDPPFTRTYLDTAAMLDRAWRASPLSDIATWRSPVLLIQGDDDHNVPFVETIRLAEALRKQGVRFETLVFPDEIHGFLLHRSWLTAYHATADFLARELSVTSP